jgi:urea transport system substrate-binding protein
LWRQQHNHDETTTTDTADNAMSNTATTDTATNDTAAGDFVPVGILHSLSGTMSISEKAVHDADDGD